MRDTADLVLLTGAADETGRADTDPGKGPEKGPDGSTAPERSANVAPTDPVRVLLSSAGSRRLREMRWGLVPPWSKDASGAARMINARIETVATKPAYRRAIRTARCVLPADGWYEWQQTVAEPAETGGRRTKPVRTPYLVQRADLRPLWLAGIWARWHPPGGDERALTTVAVLTGPAPAELSWLHERAPLAVPDAYLDTWLDGDGDDPQPVLDTLAAAGYPPLRWHPVGRGIGQVRDKGAHLMTPAGADVPPPADRSGVGSPTAAAAHEPLALF